MPLYVSTPNRRAALRISSDTALSVSIGEGESVPETPDTVLLGPVPLAANQSIPWDFRNDGMKLTEGKSLVVDSSAAGNVNVFVAGRIE
jgi:hypothetical protein